MSWRRPTGNAQRKADTLKTLNDLLETVDKLPWWKLYFMGPNIHRGTDRKSTNTKKVRVLWIKTRRRVQLGAGSRNFVDESEAGHCTVSDKTCKGHRTADFDWSCNTTSLSAPTNENHHSLHDNTTGGRTVPKAATAKEHRPLLLWAPTSLINNSQISLTVRIAVTYAIRKEIELFTRAFFLKGGDGL